MQDEDVVDYNAGTWSVSFDGTARGPDERQPGPRRDLVRGAERRRRRPPPPATTRWLLLDGRATPTRPESGGTADDADIYNWNGTRYSRVFDATASRMACRPARTSTAYDRVDATHFYVSFADNTTVPGLGTVQDEDVVYYNAGTWSVFFDGTAHGLTDAATTSTRSASSAATLYFSTRGTQQPAGGGRRRGRRRHLQLERHVATPGSGTPRANGVRRTANVDGSSGWTPRTSTCPSRSRHRPCPGVGTVQDEDVVYHNGGTWSVYFDGTAHGLTTDDLDVDAFDVP